MERGLTKSEVQIGIPYDINASPEEASLWTPIPSILIKLPIGDNIDKCQIDDIVGVSSKHYGFCSQACRRNFAYDGVNHRTDAEVSCCRQQQYHGSSGPRKCRRGIRRDTHSTCDSVRHISCISNSEYRICTNSRRQNMTTIPEHISFFLPTLFMINQLPTVPTAPIPVCPSDMEYASFVLRPALV